MKIFWQTMLLMISTQVSATSFAKAQNTKKPQLYLVEDMECKGKLTTNNPGMQPEYKNLTLTLTSMKSTRRDGTLANSLYVETSFGEVFYFAPLYLKNGRIRQNINGQIDLKVVSTKERDGKRTDSLEGSLSQEGTVVGDTSYDLECTANVVKAVSRIDDLTTGKWLKVLPENKALSSKIVHADENGSVYASFGEGENYSVRWLKGDAKKVYAKADRDSKMVETIKIDGLGAKLIHISDAPDGNGCEFLFNTDGEYLNQFCGTESGEWSWKEK